MQEISYQGWDIKALASEAIRAADDRLLQKAVEAGGIDFGSEYSYRWKVNARPLKAAGISPGEVTQRLGALISDVTGAPADIAYLTRKLGGLGKSNPNGDASVTFSSDIDAINRAFNRSDNPVISRRVQADREAIAQYEREQLQRQEEEERLTRETVEQRAREEKIRARHKGDPEARDSLRPEALCVTHATKYLPRRNADGSVEVTTTCMANNNAYPRNSTHMCLNHKVAGHMYGDWSDASYFIVAPFNDMVALNGPPAVLNTVDTYWTSGLNKTLKIPNATLVLPGDVKDGLFEIDEKHRETRYKTKGFTAGDVEAIRKKLHGYEHQEFDRNLAKYESAPDDREKLLASKANQIACNATMEHLGYTVKHGGMWAWGDSWDVTDKTRRLAADMETICCAHTGSPHGTLEDYAKTYISAVEFMKRAMDIPPDKLEYESGYYKIPGEPLYLHDDNYIKVLQGTFFQKLKDQMTAVLAQEHIDDATREVYADWEKRLEPVVERIAGYGKKLREQNAAAWRESEHERRDGPSRFINPR